jgi:hypothetical protein
MQGVLFTGLSILKPHVGLYFYPLHIEASLKSQLPSQLQNMLVGKSTFHFNRLTDDLRADIQAMLAVGWKFYQQKGWVKKSAVIKPKF